MNLVGDVGGGSSGGDGTRGRTAYLTNRCGDGVDSV